jgi:hypothetical protein
MASAGSGATVLPNNLDGPVVLQSERHADLLGATGICRRAVRQSDTKTRSRRDAGTRKSEISVHAAGPDADAGASRTQGHAQPSKANVHS